MIIIIHRSLSANLAATSYALRSDETSSISIKIDGTKGTFELDPFFAFGIDDEQYITFVTDLDGNVGIDDGGTKVFESMLYKRYY